MVPNYWHDIIIKNLLCLDVLHLVFQCMLDATQVLVVVKIFVKQWDLPMKFHAKVGLLKKELKLLLSFRRDPVQLIMVCCYVFN